MIFGVLGSDWFLQFLVRSRQSREDAARITTRVFTTAMGGLQKRRPDQADRDWAFGLLGKGDDGIACGDMSVLRMERTTRERGRGSRREGCGQHHQLQSIYIIDEDGHDRNTSRNLYVYL
jgi:hypothetical protein